jgi:hypothetical protein
MLAIIVAIVVAIWFFRSAGAVGKSGPGWAAIGIVVFFVPNFIWALVARAAIIPAAIRSDMGTGGAVALGLAIGLVGIALGLGLAVWVHRKSLQE